jgi:hypothetical protein
MRVIAAVLLLFAVYFPAATWLKLAYRDSKGPMQPLPVLGISANGSCVSRVWLPKGTTNIAVYDDDVRLGYATKVYDDPGRLEMSTKEKQWKIVELFRCASKTSWPRLYALGIKE